MPQLRHRDRALVAVGLLAAVTAGCVKPGLPGVSITPLTADIVFGIKERPPAPERISVATPPVEVLMQEDFADKVLEIPDITPFPPSRPSLQPAAPECPAAALTAFPKSSADVAVQGRPAEGVYRFKRTVTFTPAGGGPQVNSGFQQHVIRRVKPSPGKNYEFSFQMIQPMFQADATKPAQFTVTTFRVNSNPAVIRDINRAPQTIGVVPVPGAELVVTPPNDEPGIFLDKIEVLNKDGAAIPGLTYEPIRKLKYLPLEEGILKPGQTFDTVGVDADDGRAIRHQGTVIRKTRVDACGEVVEGWLIESTVTDTDDPGIERKYLYNIATQLGALFIAEATTSEIAQGTATVDLSIANPTPQPIPENLR